MMHPQFCWEYSGLYRERCNSPSPDFLIILLRGFKPLTTVIPKDREECVNATIVRGGAGIKHSCTHCDTRFFDLGKKLPVCPKCGQKVPLIAKATASRRRHADDNLVPDKDYSSQIPANQTSEPRSKTVKWK